VKFAFGFPLSQPTSGRDDESKIKIHNIKACSSPREKTSGVTTNVYSRETLEKPKKRFVNLKNKGSGVVYTWGRY